MRRRKILLAGFAAALLLLGLARHPSANIQILTHERSDTAPARVQAAVDLGVMAVSVLVTWSRQHSY